MAIDFTTAAGQVRLLVSDVDETNLALSNEMIDGFLVRYGLTPGSTPTGNRSKINRAAADAIDTIASSEALIGKVISTVDGLKTDAAKLADALRKRAWSLRQQADRDEDDAEGEQTAFFGGAGGFYTSADLDRLVNDPDHPEASEYPVSWGY